MKCFLSNCIAGASASQLLLRRLHLLLAILLVPTLAAPAAAQEFVLEIGHLADPELAAALQEGFSLDQRAMAGLLDAGKPAMAEAIEIERTRLKSLMSGFGYLDAEMDLVLDTANADYTFRPEIGQLYVIGAVAVSLTKLSDPAWAGDLEALAQTVIGSPARGDTIGQLVDDLAHRLRTSGFPFARVIGRELTADRQTGLALLQVTLDPGIVATFSAVTLADARTFTMDRLLELMTFSIGQRYAPDRVEDLRAALAAEPGLRSARVSIIEDAEGEGQLTVVVSVREVIDPEVLRDHQSAGQVAFLAVLALLALRQLTVAAGGSVHSPLVQSQTILSMIALAVAAWFVARRFIEFAGIG